MKLFLPLCAVFTVLLLMLISCTGPDSGNSGGEGNGDGSDTSRLGGPSSSAFCSAETASRLSTSLPVKVFFADKLNSKLVGEMRYIDISEDDSPLTESIARKMISLLIAGPEDTDALNPVIPAGSELTSDITVSEDGIATVSFNEKFVTNHPGTLSAEAMTLYAVTNTLTGLADITGVRFLIGGQTVAVYGGNFAMDREFPCVASLISRADSARN